MTAATDRVIVVGAGISGLAIARELAPDHDVVVLEKGSIAGDTTSRASGVISLPLEPIPEGWETAARGYFRALDGQGTFSFTERETVRLVPESDARAVAEAVGDEGSYLPEEALRARFPDTFANLAGYGGGIVYEGTGFLDVLDYAMTLKWAAERAGAAIYRDHAVTDLRVSGGEVVGVETEHGRFDADSVICAVGWRTRDLLADHVDVPVRPLRWNAVVLDPARPLPTDTPMGSEPTHRVYWRPTAQGTLLVGGNEHLVDDPVGTPARVDPEFRNLVTEEITPVLAGLDGSTIRREDCCPTADSASPDGRPIVDAPPEAPDGLVAVTGLHGRGVMLSPVTALAVRALVTGESVPIDTEALRLSRFDDRSADFEYRSHWA